MPEDKERDWTTSAFGERVAYALELRGASATRLAKALKVAASTITRDWADAQHPPNPDKATEAASLLAVRDLWLRIGHGQPALDPDDLRKLRKKSLPEDVASLLDQLYAALSQHFSGMPAHPAADPRVLAKRSRSVANRTDGES
jgi:hypothetical protein